MARDRRKQYGVVATGGLIMEADDWFSQQVDEIDTTPDGHVFPGLKLFEHGGDGTGIDPPGLDRFWSMEQVIAVNPVQIAPGEVNASSDPGQQLDSQNQSQPAVQAAESSD